MDPSIPARPLPNSAIIWSSSGIRPISAGAGPTSDEIYQSWSNIGPNLVDAGRIQPNSGRPRHNFDQPRPHFVNIAEIRSEGANARPKPANKLVDAGQTWAKFGRHGSIWAKFGNAAETGPNSASVRNTCRCSAQAWSNSGRVWALSSELGRRWPTLGWIRPKSSVRFWGTDQTGQTRHMCLIGGSRGHHRLKCRRSTDRRRPAIGNRASGLRRQGTWREDVVTWRHGAPPERRHDMSDAMSAGLTT